MSVVIETVESRALVGNPLGDPTARRSAVWLPPSYARESTRRYPVIYWLAGYSGTGEMLFSGNPWQPGLDDLPVAARTLRRRSGVSSFVEQFEASEKKSGDDYTTMMVLAQAGAYSPEAGRPGGVALPFDIETGEIDWAVWKRWKAWDPI